MSSKRGRKRNDNLPPNRARDVQRAFRARRAAHLSALEERIEELEQENSRLRAALDLPPARRPPLGTGPTGRGKLHITDSLLFETMQSKHTTPPPRERSPTNSPSSASSSSYRASGTFNFDTTAAMIQQGQGPTPHGQQQQSQHPQRGSPHSANDSINPAPGDSLIYPLPPKSTSNGSAAPNGPPTPASSDHSLPDFSFPHIPSAIVYPSILFPTTASSSTFTTAPPPPLPLLRTPASPDHVNYPPATHPFSSTLPQPHRSDMGSGPDSGPMNLSLPLSMSQPSALGTSPFGHRRSTTEPRSINIRTSHLPGIPMPPFTANPTVSDSSLIRLPSPPIPPNASNPSHRARTSISMA